MQIKLLQQQRLKKLISEKYKSLVEDSLLVNKKTKVIPKSANLDEHKLLKLKLGHLKNQRSFLKK